MTQRGFTVVEIVITLIVMAVLLTLSMAGIFQLQANARDEERRTDIESIARGLENRFLQGNPRVTAPSTVSKGAYPGVNEWLHIQGTDMSGAGFSPGLVSGGYPTAVYTGTSIASFISPSQGKVSDSWKIVCQSSCGSVDAGSQTQLQTAFGTPAKDAYFYEPVDSLGKICAGGDCVAYNLYWISETDQTTYKGIDGLKVVRSKRR